MEENTPKKSWFARNWPWVVPLGGCLTFIILLFAILGTAIFGVSKALTGSDPYKEALAKTKEDSYVIEILGEPIETNGIMQGSISFKNSRGKADISIPIKGPNGEAKVYVVGNKERGKWTYSEMYVIIKKNDEQIDLLGFE